MPSTDGHKNIFRCKVNGVEWTPHCISDFFGCSAIDCQYYKEDRSLSIRVERVYKDMSIDEGMTFYKYGILIGKNVVDTHSDIFQNWKNTSGCKLYVIDTTEIHCLELYSLDTLRNSITGTFDFVLKNSCNDTIHISDGYFDLEYRL
jgi:hypothetical protein